MQTLFRGISYVFYPGSIAALGLGYTHTVSPFSWVVWVFFLFGVVFFPLLFLFVFIRLGRVSDVFVFQREQRHQLYALGIVFAALTTYLIFRENAVMAMVWSLCNTVVMLLLFVINYIGYKASAHMAGVSGLLAWVLCLPPDYVTVLTVVFLAVLVYMARKGLSAHSHFELILGFCLGLFVTFAIACFLLTLHGINCSFI